MDKFAIEIINKMEYIETQNNWDCNELDITLNEDCITVTGVCCNEYGGRYSNEDTQDIYYDKLTQECVDYLLSLSDKYETDFLTLDLK
jgi:hypothetical protein